MKAPRFWWRPGRDPLALLLSPLATIWGEIAARRMERAPLSRASIPVLCVGNLVVGGAGKTPTALAIGRLAKEKGIAAGFLTRGYGGRAKGPLLVDPAKHHADMVGDEALLLAALAPTVIGANRGLGAELLARQGLGLAIMDDGFQNPGLAKDFSVLVADASAGIGNGLVLPAGPLRAPVGRQLARANALLVVGEGEAAMPFILQAQRAGLEVLRAELVALGTEKWRGRKVLAFAGIGRPEKFFHSLLAAGAEIVSEKAFPDHHVYSSEEAGALLGLAEHEGLTLATTAKDRARLTGATGAAGELAKRSEVLDVELRFHDSSRLSATIDNLIARRR